MLKYTTPLNNDDGIVSPSQHRDVEYTKSALELSAGSKTSAKMAIKRRGGRKLTRDIREAHLPPITHASSPAGLNMTNSIVPEKREPLNQSLPMKRKEIRTPYVSHMGFSRANDVVTPYVLHTQITNIDPQATLIARETTKLSNNVLEIKHEGELRHERTFSSLHKFPSSSSPIIDKRPRGRHGRYKNNSFNEHDLERPGDIRELAVQSNQMGLYKRADRRQRESTRGKGDESFSIRKKIEQFRRWHEEQYREKIKKLKQEVDHQFEAENNKITRQVGAVRETPTSKSQLSVHQPEIEKTENKEEKVPSEVSHKTEDEKATPILSTTNDTSKPRTESARTWHTWRNVNDSYAYNDVNKYIQENELMDDEKSQWIKKWVIEVNKAMKDIKHESML